MTLINKELAIKELQSLITNNSSIPHDNGVRESITAIREMNTVEYSAITNPDEYESLFDDLIYELLCTMGVVKGIEMDTNSDLLHDIRNAIIIHAENHHMDLSIPQKEYNVGDKVSLQWNTGIVQATIVSVGFDKYGLLIDDSLMVVLIGEGVDTATNYILELQKLHNVE